MNEMSKDDILKSFSGFAEDIQSIVLALRGRIGRMPTKEEVTDFIFGDDAYREDFIRRNSK